MVCSHRGCAATGPLPHRRPHLRDRCDELLGGTSFRLVDPSHRLEGGVPPVGHRPPVVLLGEQHPAQPDQRGPVGGDPHHRGPPLDPLVQPLQRVRRVEPGAVFLRGSGSGPRRPRPPPVADLRSTPTRVGTTTPRPSRLQPHSNRLWPGPLSQRVAGRTRSGVPSPRRIAPRVRKMFAERRSPVSPGSSPAPDRRASCLVSGGGRESNPCRPPETRDHLRPVSPRTSCRSHRPC